MNIEKVAQYLSGAAYDMTLQGGKKFSKYPFIAISRQTGAGGHCLTAALLMEMAKRPNRALMDGWQVFDDELCRKVAANPKLKVRMESLAAEKFLSPLEDVMSHALAGISRQDRVIREIFGIVRAAAIVGKSIIVGRGAAGLMRYHPAGVFVRLIAPRDRRVERMMEKLNADRETALADIESRDADRAKLVRHYFRQDIDDSSLYDCVWNTANVSIETVARTLVDIVEQRAEEMRCWEREAQETGA